MGPDQIGNPRARQLTSRISTSKSPEFTHRHYRPLRLRKSSLAFDTICAEGQRRYVESLSAYARQFLDQMERPDVDVIEGLSPSIAIEQKTTTRSPRSTVGTITEIYDYLRVIYASVGVPHCPNCGKPITRQSSEQIVQSILHGELCKPDDRIMILAPIVRGRKGLPERAREICTGRLRARSNQWRTFPTG
jgi:excinuclease UvrABC ATPase subunit